MLELSVVRSDRTCRAEDSVPFCYQEIWGLNMETITETAILFEVCVIITIIIIIIIIIYRFS
jgi:hypothetical protein